MYNDSFPTFQNHLGILPSILLLERSKLNNTSWVFKKSGNSCKLQEERSNCINCGRVEFIFPFEINRLVPERSKYERFLSSRKSFSSIVPIKFPLKLNIHNADEEVFWNLRGAVSWFRSRCSLFNEGIGNKGDGITPENELDDKSRVYNWESLLISDGIGPFNLVFEIYISLSFVRFVNEVGNSPSKLLYERYNSSSCVRLFRKDGIFPWSWRLSIDIKVSFARFPNVYGSWPVKLLNERESEVSWDRFPIEGGIAPEKWL